VTQQRAVTPGSNIGLLMTNLFDARRYTREQYGALYHSRWRVEAALKRLKNIACVWRHPVGSPTYLAFQQDFAAKVLADNFCQLLSSDTEPPNAAPMCRSVTRVPPQ
jgi:hypothetical protein